MRKYVALFRSKVGLVDANNGKHVASVFRKIFGNVGIYSLFGWIGSRERKEGDEIMKLLRLTNKWREGEVEGMAS